VGDSRALPCTRNNKNKKNIIMTRYILIVLLFVSCQKEYTVHASEESTLAMAFLKVIHAAPKLDTFNLYIGGQKMNGSALRYNSIFPIAGTNTYLAVKPGMQEIRLATDSINIYSLNKQLEAGKYYTFMITDSVNTADRDSSRIFVEDAYTMPVPGAVRIRFIHAVMNDTTVDLFSYAKNNTIITNVSPDSVSSFILLGYNQQTVDTFYVTRAAAAGTSLAARTVLAKLAFNSTNVAGAADQRSFTLYYKGDGSLVTGVKARALAGFVH
jgi:hypothetical protein